MQEPTRMSREWLTIRGKKISASELIRELDCGRIEILYQLNVVVPKFKYVLYLE